MAKFIILLSVILLKVFVTEQAYFLSEDHINQINEVAKTWKAKQNFPQSMDIKKIKILLGSKLDKLPINKPQILHKKKDPNYVDDDQVPSTFDARKQWKNCEKIGEIPNQGNCGSCWAVATSRAFSDRLCIATKGQFNQLLSTEQLTFCCTICGVGCLGGYPILAWYHMVTYGLVTGGNYNTTEGCQPYKVKPCLTDEKGVNSCAGKSIEYNHQCSKECYGDNTISYKADKHRTKNGYILDPKAIQKDVLAYGPVEATMTIYDDFLSYGSGVYEKSAKARMLGGHAVKLIGWGEENGVPYWLMVNSWGPKWGDKGLFKIRRGTNECNVESMCTAGVPKVK